jgi:hypothetical protein
MSESASGIFMFSPNPAYRGACHRAALCADPLAHAGYLLAAVEADAPKKSWIGRPTGVD